MSLFTAGGLVDALRAWHDFFMLAGGASATLLGLLFVSVALVTGLPELPKNRELFASPVVLEFAYAMLLSAICLAPWQKTWLFGVAIAGIGAGGAAQSLRLAGRTRRFRIDAQRSTVSVWYLIAPLATGIVGIASGVAIVLGNMQAIAGVAVVVVTLGLLGLRNAWSLLIWVLEEHHRSRSHHG